MEQMDQDDEVVSFFYEPKAYTISYEFGGLVRQYQPDFLVEYADGSKKLIEVKSTWSIKLARTKAKIDKVKSLRQSGEMPFPFQLIVGSGRVMERRSVINL